MGIPVQSNCDVSKPDEHFLWALVNIGGDVGAPLIVPEEILRKWSEHLFLCGFRFDPDLQARWYEPPSGMSGESFWAAPGGRWVDTEPEKVDVAGEILANLPTGVKADLKAKLLAEDAGEV
ncbi:DUF2744 domain-containing protein [Corynebacterium auriscanis]|uniref:phage gene 29 protein family protein n=1 Tax=Corynebacterium auriscanis TaxID=99807 RepID=UPI003CF6599B